MSIIYSDLSPNGVIDTETLPRAYTYNTDGTLATSAVTYGTGTWKKTYTYVSGQLSSISAWVKQ